MKFKEFLMEYTQHSISDLISRGAIPLDPGMMDRLGFLEKEVLAYHVTNDTNLEEMVKNQHKKKQISCFTKGGPELARLPSQPNILLILKGDSVIKGETDIWTLVSTRNKRWLDIQERNPKLKFMVQGVLQKIAQKLNIDKNLYKEEPEEIKKYIDSLDAKTQRKLYKMYLTEMEKMLNKNYKHLIEYLKNAADMKYNEIVLTNWEIMDAWCIEYEQPFVIEKLSKLGIPYAGIMYRKDLSSLKI